MRPTFRYLSSPPIIRIADASFRQNAEGPTLFRNLNFELPSTSNQAWAVLGGASEERSNLLHILRGAYQAFPPSSRSFPYLSTPEIAQKDPRLRSPHHAIQYVGFDAERGVTSLRGAYLSARYESRREITDFTLRNYLLGHTELNAAEDLLYHPKEDSFHQVTHDLSLEAMLELPVSHLSNGQTRRAKIAKALLGNPEVLLLNSPFMGLDPSTVESLSSILLRLAHSQSPRIVLSLNTDEHLPDWISHIMFLLRGYKIHSQGTVHEVADALANTYGQIRTQEAKLSREDSQFIDDASRLFSTLGHRGNNKGGKQIRWKRENQLEYYKAWRKKRLYTDESSALVSSDGLTANDSNIFSPGESVVEMGGVKVAYGDRTVLGNWRQNFDGVEKDGLWWNIRRGERWGVFGPNGSGKTTLTALISSDHPQSYSLPIKVFGRSRLPLPGQPGVSIFDLQKRIGSSSPELHAFFPKHLTIRQVLESAWAETPLSTVHLTVDIDERVSALLRWFQGEICPDIGPSLLFEDEALRSVYVKPEEGSDITNGSRLLNSRLEEFRNSVFDPVLLEWADQRKFGGTSFASQRLLLFLRAIIKSPDIVVLDEPFSGLDAAVVQKCNMFLAHGETKAIRYRKDGQSTPSQTPVPQRTDLDRLGLTIFKGMTKDQAFVFISHRKSEVPGIIREWMCLPEPGTDQAPRFGRFSGPMEVDPNRWRQVWGQPEIVQREYKTYVSAEERRAAFNAYHYRYFRNESLEQRMKRNDRLRNYTRSAPAYRKEEISLRGYRSRHSMPLSAEKILDRSMQTAKDAVVLMSKILRQDGYPETPTDSDISSIARINSAKSTSNSSIEEKESTYMRYLTPFPMHVKAARLLARSRRDTSDAEEIIARILDPQIFAHSIKRKAEKALRLSHIYISRAEAFIARITRHPSRNDRIWAEAKSLHVSIKYRLAVTSKRLEMLANSRKSKILQQAKYMIHS